MKHLGSVLAVTLLLTGAVIEACGTDAVTIDNPVDASSPDAGALDGKTSSSDDATTSTNQDGTTSPPDGSTSPDDGASPADATSPDDAGPTDGSTGDEPPVDSAAPLLANGAACAVGDAGAGDAGAGNCQSGYCVDGVCCGTPCDGTCARCDLADTVGTCSPVGAGKDPDQECLGLANQTNSCSGACDGAGSCSFPETACGAKASCTGATSQTSNHSSCNNGVCVPISQDCSVSGFCDKTTGVCEGLKDNGTTCIAANECKTGKCIDSACCATSCSAPSSCASGACLCNGIACTAGAACITWYVDGDGDGYGAAASGPSTVSCANVKPAAFNGKQYAPSTKIDCYDANANAYPGSGYSSVNNRGDGSYDYNCDGVQSGVYSMSVQGLTCAGCPSYNPYPTDPCHNACTAYCGTNCKGAANVFVGWGCSAACTILGSNPTEGWTSATPSCGGTGTWGTCTETTPSAGHCAPAVSSASRQQPCY